MTEQTTDDEHKAFDFETCVTCGGKDTLTKLLTRKIAEKGLATDGYPTCLVVWPIIMRKQGTVPVIGTKAPAGQVEMDICMKCGTLRAVKVSIGEAIIMPGPIPGPLRMNPGMSRGS